MKMLNRRAVLQGLGGIALGLPFLEGLVPRSARAQALVAPKRVIFFFEVNGCRMDTFWPVNPASGAQLQATTALTDANLTGTCLAPLAGRTGKLLVTRGFEMSPPGYQGNGCDHKKGMGHKLTAYSLDATTFLPLGPSVDQAIAAKLNPPGRQALSLAVGYQSPDVLGYISYTGPKQPVVGETNPWYAYQRFMAMGGSTPDAGVMIDVAAKRKSVIDLVQNDFSNLQMAKLSTNDVQKLDMHLTIIRELETSMAAPDAGTGPPLQACLLDPTRAAQVQATNGDPTVTADVNFEKIGQMQLDIMALAVACNYTVAGTILFGRGSGGPVYKWIDNTMVYNHHPLSHRATSDSASGGYESVANPQLLEIDTWHAKQFAYLIDRLSGYTEGSGTVLDNSAAIWINELSDGESHNYQDLPIVIAGSLGGYLKQGQFIGLNPTNAYTGYTAHNALHTTLMNGVGIPTTHFGEVGTWQAGGISHTALDGEVAAIKA
jgi:hypothetical protein